MSDEDFYTRFSDTDDGSILISRGPRTGQISLKLTQDRLFVLIEGEPEGELLTQCFEEALAATQSKMDVPTLVDLTRFRGSVDWSALFEVRAMTASWDKKGGKTSLVAYVVRADGMLDMVIKAVGALFSDGQHRIFANHSEALAWLDRA